MRVTLKQGRVGHIIGKPVPNTPEKDIAIRQGKEVPTQEHQILGMINQEKGDVIEVSDAEGQRMIAAGQAVAVAAEKK